MTLNMAGLRPLRPILAVCIALQLIAAPAIAPAAEDKSWFGSLFGTGKDSGGASTDFEIPDLNGAKVKLSQFKGQRAVLLYFWATWCAYCIQIKPEVVKLRHSVPEEQLEILAVNVGGGDTVDRLKKYQEAHPSPWTVLFDGEQKVTRSYKITGIPYFILVDKDGTVAYKGNMPPEDVKKLLKL